MQEKLTVQRIFIKLLILCGIITMFLAILSIKIGIIQNNSDSMPVGKYLTLPIIKPVIGNTYTVCLSRDKQEYLNIMNKLGLSSGNCPNGYISLLKQVIAESGDIVTISQDGVHVNGHLIVNSQQSHYSDSGIYLSPLPINYKHTLSRDEYFMMGLESRSYDSRYFGIVTESEITNRAIFIGQI